jgi:hypothetical protein
MARPGDEQVETPTVLRGAVTHNGGGPLRVTGRQETRAKNARLDARERRALAGKTRGDRRGSQFLRGGHLSPCRRGEIPPSTPASLPAAVRLNDLRVVPPASTKCNFLVLFPRNVEPHRVGFENRRDLGEFLTGGWYRLLETACSLFKGRISIRLAIEQSHKLGRLTWPARRDWRPERCMRSNLDHRDEVGVQPEWHIGQEGRCGTHPHAQRIERVSVR